MPDIAAIQAALRDFSIDGWLLYDFHGNNPLARRVLEIDAIGTRRFFYYVPAVGEPAKLVHRIESGMLDHLPGATTVYLKWQELIDGVAQLVGCSDRVAMEYSPRAANPYIARVDAGTVELVESCGPSVVSSGDLIQQFEATWSDKQWEMHQQAALLTDRAFERVWQLIADRVRSGRELRESEVQADILEHFAQNGLITSHAPIVAADRHSGDPHFETGGRDDAQIAHDSFVLVDLWAKVDTAAGVYSDLTRVAYVGEKVPDRYQAIFKIVAAARDAAIELVREAFLTRRPLAGWEVDQAARAVIESAGYGEHFIHRTGHSIGSETHGNGANMDNLETRDERQLLPGTCFSIEPGIYLPEFGIRSETNVFIQQGGTVVVTGGDLQTEVLPVLARF